MQTIVVSSNWTLFFKLLFPAFWGVFWGASALMFWIAMPDGDVGALSDLTVKILVTSFFLSSMGLLYFLFGNLKRVEMAEDFFYVTNYFKTCRYTYDSIAKVEEGKKIMGIQPVALLLHEKSTFGKSIPFLATDNFYKFFKDNPQVFYQTNLEY